MALADPTQLWSIAENLTATGAYDATGSGTKCNLYFCDFAQRGWNYNGLRDATGVPKLANDIISEISTSLGWTVLADMMAPIAGSLQPVFDDATQRATYGQLVMIGVQAPAGLHGHLATVLPISPTIGNPTPSGQWSPVASSVPWVAQAGESVFPAPPTNLGYSISYAKTQTPGWRFMVAALI